MSCQIHYHTHPQLHGGACRAGVPKNLSGKRNTRAQDQPADGQEGARSKKAPQPGPASADLATDPGTPTASPISGRGYGGRGVAKTPAGQTKKHAAATAAKVAPSAKAAAPNTTRKRQRSNTRQAPASSPAKQQPAAALDDSPQHGPAACSASPDSKQQRPDAVQQQASPKRKHSAALGLKSAAQGPPPDASDLLRPDAALGQPSGKVKPALKAGARLTQNRPQPSAEDRRRASSQPGSRHGSQYAAAIIFGSVGHQECDGATQQLVAPRQVRQRRDKPSKPWWVV